MSFQAPVFSSPWRWFPWWLCSTRGPTAAARPRPRASPRRADARRGAASAGARRPLPRALRICPGAWPWRGPAEATVAVNDERAAVICHRHLRLHGSRDVPPSRMTAVRRAASRCSTTRPRTCAWAPWPQPLRALDRAPRPTAQTRVGWWPGCARAAARPPAKDLAAALGLLNRETTRDGKRPPADVYTPLRRRVPPTVATPSRSPASGEARIPVHCWRSAPTRGRSR